VLSGCSLLIPAVHPKPAPSSSTAHSTTGEPSAGQCWNGTIGNAGDWADWQGGAATACSKPHTLYTYAIGHVSGLQPTDWAVSSSNPALSDKVAAAASATCDEPYAKIFPSSEQPETLLRTYFFVPTRAQWKGGARWVRCDVALVDFGTRVSEERFADLPTAIGTLVADMTSDPAAYGLCVDTGHSVKTGPFADKTDVITDCRDNPEWVFLANGTFSQAAGAAYPAKSAITARLNQVCGSQLNRNDEIWSGYYPTAATWKTGDRAIQCWAAFKDWTPAGTGGTTT